MKHCPKCKTNKSKVEFYVLKSGKLNSWCKSCSKAQSQEYRKANPEAVVLRNREWAQANPERKKAATTRWHRNNPDKVKEKKLKVFGLTLSQYREMLKAQDNRCAICMETHSKLAVDHCHDTGKVRALLCIMCNLAIGNMKDNADIARRAELYLRLHGEQNEQGISP